MKKGLKEFIELYDLWTGKSWLALDLAQNLNFRFEFAKNKEVTEEDVHMAYGVIGGRKYPGGLIGAIHNLAKALDYTHEDYIEGDDKRRGKGNVNIQILGEGRSINCGVKDLLCKENQQILSLLKRILIPNYIEEDKMKDKKKHKVEFPMCSHPPLLTQWNKPEPEPCRTIGDCSLHSYICPFCGLGRGCYPSCNCGERRY